MPVGGTGIVTEIFLIGAPAVVGAGTTAEKVVVALFGPVITLKVSLSPVTAPCGRSMSTFCPVAGAAILGVERAYDV